MADEDDRREREGSGARALGVDALMEENARLRERMARLERKSLWMQEIGIAVGRQLPLEEVMGLLTERIEDLMDASVCSLYLLDAQGTHLWTRKVAHGVVRETRLRVGEGVAGWVAQQGISINLKDVRQDPRFRPWLDARDDSQARSVLCQPMRNQLGSLIGVVEVRNKRSGYFSLEDETLLGAMTNTAAILLENHRLFLDALRRSAELQQARKRLEDRIEHLNVLYALQQHMFAATSIGEALRTLADHILGVLGASHFFAFLSGSGVGSTYACTAQGELLHVPGSAAGAPAFLAWLASRGGRWHGDPGDAGVDPWFAALAAPLRSLLVVPLQSGGEPMGYLVLANACDLRSGQTLEGFSEADRRLLTLMAGPCVVALQQAAAQQKRLEEDRLSTIGRMLSGVLHDLRGPLAAIHGYAQLMEGSEDPQRRRRYVSRIRHQIDLLARMTKDVLAYARGERALLLRQIDVRTFFQDVEERLRHELDGTNMALSVECRASGLATWDESKLLRVFSNLARNAREAMQRSAGHFSILVEEAGDSLVFTCADDGRGVPEAMQERVFDAFVSSGKEGSTGLGLAIVRRFVEEHQGSVALRSRPGEGTTFLIELPRHTPEPHASPGGGDAHAESAAS